MEEGRTHMSRKHNWFILVPGLFVGALLAACNRDAVSPDRGTLAKPSFKKITGGGCPVTKFTGGGRIDPPNPDWADGASGVSTITGKVTFGFNVFLADQGGGNCIVSKSEIQVVHHPSQTRWHVSIHNGVSDFGETVAATSFPSPSGKGSCVIVGPVTARVNGQQGSELVRMTACDNGEPGSQQPRISSSGPDSFRWQAQATASTPATAPSGDTDLTLLTGGNIQAH
jgi:hypothetical protein